MAKDSLRPACRCTPEMSSCECGFYWEQRHLNRLWRTTSLNEARIILHALNMLRADMPHPPDINDVRGEPGDRHPVYTAYVWYLLNGALRWVFDPAEGN